MSRLWPKSLVGQLLLVVALALFGAQLFNLGLHYRASERLRMAEAVSPIVGRVAEAEERGGLDESQRRGPRRFFRIERASAVTGEARQRVARLEARVRDAMTSEGLGDHAVEIGVADADAERFREFRRGGPGRGDDRGDDRRNGRDDDRANDRGGNSRIYRVSVPLEDGRWLNGWMRLHPRNFTTVGVVIAQSLVLYLIVLLALWWFARRVARPLGALTRSAEQFDESAAPIALAVTGPEDIARLTMAYNAMRVRIAAMLEEKDHMLGAIGHDLRTPLAALRIRAENVDDESERSRMIETIEDMSAMLEDILSLARLGRTMRAAERLDLTALVDSAIEDFRDIGAPVEMEEGVRIVIEGQANLLKRAIRNLIENAVRYGKSARVRVSQDRWRGAHRDRR